MRHEIRVTFPSDCDGFISKRCPSCIKGFKVQITDEGDTSLEHCPYCGAPSNDGWFTEEQEAHLAAVCEQGLDHILESSDRDLEWIHAACSQLSLSTDSENTVVPPKPVESNQPMRIFSSPCCGEPVKYNGSPLTLYCVICGTGTAL